LICGDNGAIIVYEKTEEPKNPYNKLAVWPSATSSSDKKKESDSLTNLMLTVQGGKIKSMTLNSAEDNIMFTTENNQIMKCKINLERANDETKYEFLMKSFHQRSITGLDVCIKKKLIVTCSEDKSVRIWDYENKQLEIFQSFPDQAHSVAFHPSGFHIIVGFSDKVRMLNVFQDELKDYKELHIK